MAERIFDGFRRFCSICESHSPLLTMQPTSAEMDLLPISSCKASRSVMSSCISSIRSSKAFSLAWLTSTHFPLRKASPSVCASRWLISVFVSAIPSTTSFGCIETNVSKPSMDGFFSPSRISTLHSMAFLRHQFGIRQRIPVCSIFSTSRKNCQASWEVNCSTWNISPFSTNSAIKGETSAAWFRQESNTKSFSRWFWYSVNAYFKGMCCTWCSPILDAYVAIKRKGSSPFLFSTKWKKIRSGTWSCWFCSDRYNSTLPG